MAPTRRPARAQRCCQYRPWHRQQPTGQRARGRRCGRPRRVRVQCPAQAHRRGGDTGCLERIGGHVDARCTLRAGGLGGLERGDGGADLRLIAVVLGRGAGITGYNRRQLERFRALLVRCQNGLFQRLTSGGAHLVHGGKAHTAAGVERNVKARGLKGRGAHAPDVLNQIGRLDRAGLGGLDGKARGRGRKRRDRRNR